MVEQTRLDSVFQALSDPVRRGMLARLMRGQRTVGELAGPLAMSFAGASKHVHVLERAGLVSLTRKGRHRICRLEPAGLATADAWLEPYRAFWEDRLDRLEAALGDGEGEPA